MTAFPLLELVARYEDAEREYLRLHEALQKAVRRRTIRTIQHTSTFRVRSNAAQAEAMYNRVQVVHRANPELSQSRIGELLGLTRDQVSYYLNKYKPLPQKTALVTAPIKNEYNNSNSNASEVFRTAINR